MQLHVLRAPRCSDFLNAVRPAGQEQTEGELARIFIEPVGLTAEIEEGATLLPAVSMAAVGVPVDCGGRGTCGKCLVRVGAGELTSPTEAELRKIPAERLEQGWRLACQARPITSNVSIEVRGTAGRRQILTVSHLTHKRVHPAVVKSDISLPPATFDDPRSDLARIRQHLGVRDVPLPVLSKLTDALREGDFRVTVTRNGGTLVDVERPGADPVLLGAAVDIGTSKIITYLVDLRDGRLIDQEAIENPQMRLGEDVVTRITEAVENGRLTELANVVREGINETLERQCARQDIPAGAIYDMTVVGNTAMHHLALGLSPLGLASAPFAPALDEPLTLRSADLGLEMNGGGEVYFVPPIAGFVGSDCLAVIAATHLASRRGPAMAIDIGTNTEIALVHEREVTVTSCASGPAFEGYQIQCGMKATEGAIERVSISPAGKPGQVETIGGSRPVGICGSGVVDALAGLFLRGIVDGTGRMHEHELVRRGARGLEYVIAAGVDGDDVVFTQNDVRALQLAKGAIAAGWSLLLEHRGLQPSDLRRLYVAGAFGNYLGLDNALAIGLLPPIPKSRISYVGNAAGVGAQIALIDVHQRRRMAQVRRRIRFVELAVDARFHEVFTRELSLGHHA